MIDAVCKSPLLSQPLLIQEQEWTVQAGQDRGSVKFSETSRIEEQ